jgi:polyhydroxybutyrate depolymerase
MHPTRGTPARARRRASALVLALSLGAALGATASSTAAGGAQPRALAPGDHTETLVVGGLVRSFVLHVPPGPAVPNRPLLLIYHGATDTDVSTIETTDFEAVANQKGEVDAFLQGVNDRWNEFSGKFATAAGGPNDVAYTSAAIIKIEALIGFDHQRIAAVGFSSGALMVESLGCQLASTLAEVVPVEGELATPMSAPCAPKRPIQVYEVHGTADTAIPYGGGHIHGPYGTSTFTVLSAPRSIARWAQLDHCTAPTTSTPTTNVQLTHYWHCRDGTIVTLRTIVRGVHQWGSNIGVVVAASLPKVPA